MIETKETWLPFIDDIHSKKNSIYIYLFMASFMLLTLFIYLFIYEWNRYHRAAGKNVDVNKQTAACM